MRSLTHKNVSERDRQEFEDYRVIMVGFFTQTLAYLKTSVNFTKDMCMEFVDEVVQEFPNWKPEDFMLWCRMAKRGDFKTEFQHSVDYPTLFQWLHQYDKMILDAIESERVYHSHEEPARIPEKVYTQTDVDAELKKYYDLVNSRKKQIEPVRGKEPELWAHIRQAQIKYREARLKYAHEAEGSSAHPYRLLAAEDEFTAANPEKEWLMDFIEQEYGYKTIIE